MPVHTLRQRQILTSGAQTDMQFTAEGMQISGGRQISHLKEGLEAVVLRGGGQLDTIRIQAHRLLAASVCLLESRRISMGSVRDFFFNFRVFIRSNLSRLGEPMGAYGYRISPEIRRYSQNPSFS